VRGQVQTLTGGRARILEILNLISDGAKGGGIDFKEKKSP